MVRRSGVIVVGLALVSLPQQALADEAQAKAAIVKLLNVGWAVTPQARAAADLQTRELLQIAGDDERALTASWLVLLHQHRYEDALKRINEQLAKSPEKPDAL